MALLKIISYVIGVSQLALGALYLLTPIWFINWQGLSAMAPDAAYPLAMLGGRFLVYGVGMFLIAQAPDKHRFWGLGMVAIQVIDLTAGLFYVATGVVPLADAALPMFDAALFAGLLGYGYARLSRQPVAQAVN